MACFFILDLCWYLLQRLAKGGSCYALCFARLVQQRAHAKEIVSYAIIQGACRLYAISSELYLTNLPPSSRSGSISALIIGVGGRLVRLAYMREMRGSRRWLALVR